SAVTGSLAAAATGREACAQIRPYACIGVLARNPEEFAQCQTHAHVGCLARPHPYPRQARLTLLPPLGVAIKPVVWLYATHLGGTIQGPEYAFLKRRGIFQSDVG